MSRYRLAGLTAVLVVIGDQLTKWLIVRTLPLGSAVAVIESCLHIVHVRNSGGAFSLLADAPAAWRLPFFLLASALAVVALLYFLRELRDAQRGLTVAIGGVLGGALGNLIDRATAGYVTDFVDLHWRGWHWPAFNVADAFITVGVIVLVAHSFWGGDDAEGRT